MAIAFNIGCPDKKGCSHLASRPLVIGFMCVGKLKAPTDHVFKGVNDLQFCFRQNGRLNRWHFNRGDIRLFRFLLGKAEKRLEATDAVHNTGAKEDSRPGD